MKFKTNRPTLVGGALALVCFYALAFKDPPTAALLQRTVSQDTSRLPRGTPAPDFRLATAQGEEVALEQLRGELSVLVFISPTCPHCKHLKEKLLEQGLPDLQRHLVLISQAGPELKDLPADVQDLETRIAALVPVLQDSAGSTFESYKVMGVPTGYLLSAEGKVARAAVGVPENLKLVQKLVEEKMACGDASRGCKGDEL